MHFPVRARSFATAARSSTSAFRRYVFTLLARPMVPYRARLADVICTSTADQCIRELARIFHNCLMRVLLANGLSSVGIGPIGRLSVAPIIKGAFSRLEKMGALAHRAAPKTSSFHVLPSLPSERMLISFFNT